MGNASVSFISSYCTKQASKFSPSDPFASHQAGLLLVSTAVELDRSNQNKERFGAGCLLSSQSLQLLFHIFVLYQDRPEFLTLNSVCLENPTHQPQGDDNLL